MDAQMLEMLGKQLLYHLPTLGAAVLGMVLAGIYWKRCPPAAMMTVSAGVLFFLASAVNVVSQVQFMNAARLDMNRDAASMQAWAMLATVLRAGAVVLLVLAVFNGRQPSAEEQNPWN
jgi:hypothetical protein